MSHESKQPQSADLSNKKPAKEAESEAPDYDASALQLPGSAASILRLQRLIGNQAVIQMLKAAEPPQKSKPQPLTAPTKGETRHLIQRVRVKLPTGVSLKGGNGVSVLWPSNGSQSGAHVTVAHGLADVKTGM